MRGRQRSDLP